jgi:AbrB family looped-hinge helix DNA binding protein
MMTETFVGEIIESGRVTIPETIRDLLNLCKGDKVRVTVEKVKAEEA